MPDLFGQPDPTPSTSRYPARKARGYAAAPGTGPADETCGSCRHLARLRTRIKKCALNRAAWTRGEATDVRARSAACRKWQANPEENTHA